MTKGFSRGFTLLELLILIAFLVILASFGYPVLLSALERAKITQDLNNLRQIGLATQSYLSDNDNNLFSSGALWMSQLHPKYLPGWNVFQSPFDKRRAVESDTTSPVSYGVNANIYADPNNAMAAAKISKPIVFIFFAPAQTSAPTVTFQGIAGTGAPGVTVLGVGSNTAASSPGGNATAGPQNSRQRINAVFADVHCESLPWTVFTNNTSSASDPWAAQRWSP